MKCPICSFDAKEELRCPQCGRALTVWKNMNIYAAQVFHKGMQRHRSGSQTHAVELISRAVTLAPEEPLYLFTVSVGDKTYPIEEVHHRASGDLKFVTYPIRSIAPPLATCGEVLETGSLRPASIVDSRPDAQV